MLKSEFIARLEIFPFVKDYYCFSMRGGEKSYHLCYNKQLEEYGVFFFENGQQSRKESFPSIDDAYDYLWNISIGDDMAIGIRNNPGKYGITKSAVKYKYYAANTEIVLGSIALLLLSAIVTFGILAINNTSFYLSLLVSFIAFCVLVVVLIDTIIKHIKTTKKVLYTINRRAAIIYPNTIPDYVIGDLDKGYLKEYFKKEISGGVIRDFDVIWDGQAFAVIFDCNTYDICLEEESIVITLEDGTIEKEIYYEQINNPDNSTRLIYERIIKEISNIKRKEKALATKNEENTNNVPKE